MTHFSSAKHSTIFLCDPISYSIQGKPFMAGIIVPICSFIMLLIAPQNVWLLCHTARIVVNNNTCCNQYDDSLGRRWVYIMKSLPSDLRLLQVDAQDAACLDARQPQVARQRHHVLGQLECGHEEVTLCLCGRASVQQDACQTCDMLQNHVTSHIPHNIAPRVQHMQYGAHTVTHATHVTSHHVTNTTRRNITFAARATQCINV